MGIKEFYKWWEYLSKEPILADRIEIQLASLSLMVSSFGGSKFKHSDFMIVKQEKPILSQKEKNKQLITAFKNL